MADPPLLFNPRRGTSWFRLGMSASNWHRIPVPKNASWLFLWCGDGGGGGGGGFAAATSSVKSGGSGGAGGAHAKLWIPANALPRPIYCSPGFYGAGAASAQQGTDGSRSFISRAVNSTIASDLILVSSTATTNSGGAAGGAAAGGASTAPTIATIGLTLWATLGFWQAYVGQAGGNSSVTAKPAAIAWGSLPWCGGVGGGCATALNAVFDGGNVTGVGAVVKVAGGISAAGGPGAKGGGGHDGQSNFQCFGAYPFAGSAGGGGGSSATAGAGGDAGQSAGVCSGGSGGGAGVTAGGAGANGAPGFVYAQWW